jgi:hypothetical protein
MRKFINFIRRGVNQFITNGVWRLAVYQDGKLIDISQTVNVSAADPFIWQKQDGSLILLFESYSPFKILKRGRIFIGDLDPDSFSLSNVKLLHEEAGHVSFPTLVNIRGQVYFCCEASYRHEIALWKFDENSSSTYDKRKTILSKVKGLDPFFFATSDHIYLFFSLGNRDNSVTRLYQSSDLDEKFHEHPDSPIAKGSRYGRIASSIFTFENKLFRTTQSNMISYGDGMNIFEVKILNTTSYKEIDLGEMKRPLTVSNIHTRTEADNICIIDYYKYGLNLKKWKFLWKMIRRKYL